jgi:hypothetical protein
LLLILELDLTFVWSNELSIFLLEPVKSLNTLSHLDGTFPAAELLLGAANIYRLVVAHAWNEDGEANEESLPLVIDLSILHLLVGGGR